MRCKKHSDNLAIFKCERCNGFFCNECVTSRRISESFTAYICIECGGKCDLIKAEKGSREKKPREPLFSKKQKDKKEKIIKVATIKQAASSLETNFWKQLLPALIFPFKGKGILITALFTGILFGLSRPQLNIYPSIKIILVIIFATYCSMYLFRIIDDSYSGSRTLPPMISLGYWQKTSSMFIYIAGIAAICMMPAHIYLLITGALDVFFLVFLVLGMFFAPMSVMRLIILKNAKAINPLKTVLAISKTIFPYLALCIIFAFLTALFIGLNSEIFIRHGAYGYAGSCAFLVIVVFIQMHILGVFSRNYQKKMAKAP